MSRSDFVSVTIVTYNSGRFIKRCLESVLAQKYALKEVIVVDNNSSDGTIDILEPFEARCRIVYNERHSGSGTLPARDDRRHLDFRRILRCRFLRLSRGCRRRLARAVNGLEVPLCALCARLSRAQSPSRKPPSAPSSHQHAFGEEPLP